MVEYNKPLPQITPENKPFWEACKQHELSLQRCQDCGHLRLPSPICQKCLSMNSEWVKVSGRGKVYTWVVIHQRYHPGFVEELPYNVTLVELEEGPKLITNIVGCNNEDLRIGMEVEVVFEDVTEEITLPKFKPVS
ncbi:MAG: Zn-ribbon domain-containing OB-fold protein [Dehalococcoidia bacterium]|nr:MAG: Zn-ribbon domain-containing OB-fold protein [Dehalococcoidia bacterium]